MTEPRLPQFDRATLHHLAGVADVVLGRGNREVLIDGAYGEPGRSAFRARVSCDGGKTWGWQIISREELVEAMGS